MSKLLSIYTFLFYSQNSYGSCYIHTMYIFLLLLHLIFEAYLIWCSFNLWQSILFLSSLLKRIDRLLQFDRCIHLLRIGYNEFYPKILVIDCIYLERGCIRLMPSYNGILTISCIRTLTQIGLKLSGFIPLVSVFMVFTFFF